MSDTQAVLLEAAEALVREQGLGALSVRSLAARANYGKSTVHEAVGGMDQLVAGLRLRAIGELVAVCANDQPALPEDAEGRSRLYRRMSRWILDNPNWARLCFVHQGVDESHSWAHAVANLLMGVLPEGTEDLDDADGALLAHLSTAFGAAMTTTIIAVGDVEYGADVIHTTFTAIHGYIEGLIDHRAHQSAQPLTRINLVEHTG